MPSSISFTDTLVAKESSLTKQNKFTSNSLPNSQPLTKTHARDTYNYSHAYKTSHTSQNTKDKNCSHQVSNISNFSCTKIDSREPSDIRQTLHTSAQINTIKKNNKKIKKKLEEEKEEVGSLTKNSIDKKELKSNIVNSQTIDSLTEIPKEKPKNRVLCYKCNRFGHYQNNCKPPKNKNKSKLDILELRTEINTVKQEIQEIKNSSFQITEEQLAQEMVTLKINNNHP